MRNSKSHFTFFVLLVFLLSNTFTFASGTKRPKPDSEGSIDEIPKREKVKEDEISDENDFGQRYQPKTNTTWHWHLDSEAIYKFPVDLYDIDLFLNSADLKVSVVP